MAQNRVPVTPKPLTVGPVAYFAEHCERCHGSRGRNLGKGFAKRYSEATLRKEVAEMAAGPGQAALEGIDLDAQVGLHWAIDSGRPFLAWTGRKGDQLSGEVLNAKSVWLVVGGRKRRADVHGDSWVIRIPNGMNLDSVSLVAGVKPQVILQPARRPFAFGR
ncbi:MAG: hypothetical protein HYR64_09015 [Fimbriimonas ginsengisoli]|uniref:Cytochrome c domain-containing protein n=1 Tax=Fimbriimonas ginsengisoli TaxID=1005039 RepID=A0A931PX11_FIMGI|nr:hypothetical protein [Fimbriimonas ginsengisoli]